MLGLARIPLKIVRVAAGTGFELGRFAYERVFGNDDSDRAPAPAPTTSPAATQTPTEARRRPEPSTPPVSPSAAAVATARTEPPPAANGASALRAPGEPEREAREPAPRHLDTEDEQVASFGPESDVGAAISVEAPWDGYDDMAAQQVIDRIRASDDTTKAAVLLYERQGKNRKTVIAAAGG